MNGRAIPDDQELAGHLAQELAEEGADRRAAIGFVLDMGEEPSVRGEGADHGEMVARKRQAQDRRLSHWRVGAGEKGQEIKARLVYEEDGALLGMSFA